MMTAREMAFAVGTLIGFCAADGGLVRFS